MRVALLTLALLCLLLAVAAVGLFAWAREPILVNITTVYLADVAAAVGFVVALATVVAGLAAMSPRRQWGWLTGLIVAWLLSAVGSVVAVFVTHPLRYYVV
jgi:hypothetical protein